MPHCADWILTKCTRNCIAKRSHRPYTGAMKLLLKVTFSSSALLCALTLVAATAQAAPHASIVVQMNDLALESMKTAGFAPPLVARTLAVMHVGFLEIESRADLTETEKKTAEIELGRLVLATNLPPLTALINKETRRISDSFALFPNLFTDAAADRTFAYLVSWRRGDSQALAAAPWISVDAQHWNPMEGQTAAFQNWGTAASFLGLKNPNWRIVLPEVGFPDVKDKRVNMALDLGEKSSKNRTPEMTETAQFWSQGAKTVTPPGQWNRIAQDAATRMNLLHNEEVRMFAELNIALAEVSIHCWTAKYHFLVLRPIQVARASGDMNWQPLLDTPSHPEYPSGHSSFSAAAAAVLESWAGDFGMKMGGDQKIEIVSEDLPGVVRIFSSYQQAAHEAGMSRIYGGIHFLWSDDEGQKLGRKVAYETMHDVEEFRIAHH